MMIDLATALRQHRNYDAGDLDYLRSRGWTDRQIFDRWSADADAGLRPVRLPAPSERAKLLASTPTRRAA